MYFKTFPYIEYQFPDDVIRVYKNLSIRPGLVKEIYGNSNNLQDYIIQDGQTPETIAFDVYEDVNMHWAVMLPNNILNLYTDWPMGTSQFDMYLFNKYKNQIDSDGNAVVMDETQTQEFVEFAGTTMNDFTSMNSANVWMKPHHFVDDDGDTYSYDSVVVANMTDAFGRTIVMPTVYPVSIYDYEFERNEQKRVIQLLAPSLANRMKRELQRIVNG